MKYLIWGSMLLILLSALFLAWPAIARSPEQTTFVVNDSRDDATNAVDKNPGDGVCESWYGTCTLRAAIQETNAIAGADTITFQSSMTITVASALPELTDYTTIDASSVWDTANDRPGVTLSGNGVTFDGLRINQLYCAVYGLFITGFDDAIYVYSSNNSIGGTGQGQRNVLSGNSGCGVCLVGLNANSNTVEGNYIGLDVTGSGKLANRDGVYLAEGASFNNIQYNWISGNTGEGISILQPASQKNKITGNTIGLDKTNVAPVGNGRSGILIQQASTTTVTSNLIATNSWHGISLSQADSTDIELNTIYGNSMQGIYVSQSYDSKIYDNAIFSNQGNGVLVDGAAALRNEIWRNSIHSNIGKGISLINGGNNNLSAPVIQSVSATTASGTASASTAYVQVYSDSAEEGEVYEATCIVDHTSGHQWQCSGMFTGPNVTALAFDGSGNTSEFSAPCSTNGCRRVFIPLVMRNH